MIMLYITLYHVNELRGFRMVGMMAATSSRCRIWAEHFSSMRMKLV